MLQQEDTSLALLTWKSLVAMPVPFGSIIQATNSQKISSVYTPGKLFAHKKVNMYINMFKAALSKTAKHEDNNRSNNG